NSEIQTAVISNGVDTSHFKKTNADEFFKKYNLDKTNKHLLFVGRFHPEKSIDTLIKAVPNIIAAAPKTHIILAGSGHQEEAMKKLATSLNLDEYITFCGKVSDEDLVLAYSAADVFVLTSLAELEGMVVLEAMACGMPLLIADAKDSASVFLVDGNGFLFKAEDYNDLARNAVRLLNDDELLKIMSKKSLQLSREYDINRSVDKLLDLYYSIL
ncbi:glycosyltransferase, partial [Patescibacteria group bacterium]|nr:glycosyltransferase [Patescibacteria group bacterium]